jgi:hypothetical protein
METRTATITTKVRLAKPLIAIGWTFLGLALTLFLALFVYSYREQAKTPGVKNFGVAVLFMMYGIPAVFCGTVGLICLLIGFIFQRIG